MADSVRSCERTCGLVNLRVPGSGLAAADRVKFAAALDWRCWAAARFALIRSVACAIDLLKAIELSRPGSLPVVK